MLEILLALFFAVVAVYHMAHTIVSFFITRPVEAATAVFSVVGNLAQPKAGLDAPVEDPWPMFE